MVLDVDELALSGSVGERHVLEFTLASCIAHGAIERMVGEYQFQHRLTGLVDFVVLSGDDHALADYSCARGLQLRHLLDLYQAHAASALHRETGVVTERRNFYAC